MNKLIFENELDRRIYNWLIENGVSPESINHAVNKIILIGRRPYISNVAKYYGFDVANFDSTSKANHEYPNNFPRSTDDCFRTAIHKIGSILGSKSLKERGLKIRSLENRSLENRSLENRSLENRLPDEASVGLSGVNSNTN